MGIIMFEGQQPFELALQQPPTASTEGGSVLMMLPVLRAGHPASIADVRVLMSIEQAEKLAARLQPALMLARAGSRKGS
jgi:hypothetical protein